MTDISIDTPAPHGDPGRSHTAAVGVALGYTGDLPTIRIGGDADSTKATDLASTINGLLAVGVRELVVDLTGAHNAAVLLPVLAKARRDLLAEAGTLRVVGVVVPEILDALSAAPLDEVFIVYDAVRDRESRRRSRSTPL
jgi:hypothetical protein